MFTGHKISTLEELKQGGAQSLQSEEAPPPKCSTHDEPKKLYCSNCKHLICRDCTVIDHTGHKYEFVKKAAPEVRKTLIEQVTPLKELACDIQEAVAEVKSAKTAVEANGVSVADQINGYFQQLQAILEERRKQLLAESSQIVEKKVESLSAQEKNMSLSLATVQSLTDFVERTLANASDEEVVTMQAQVLSRIEGEVAKQKGGVALSKPVQQADLGVELNIAESLRGMCATEAALKHGVDARNCTVEGVGAKTAEIETPAHVTVSTFDYNGLPTKTAVNVRGELRSLVDGSVLKLQGVHQHTNQYTVQYTPKVRGRHQLSITVNGDHIPGSPFSVFVRVPPTKLDQPFRVISGIRDAKYIAFNSSEEIIITKWDQGIDVLDKNGTKRHSISDHRMGDAGGVAVDRDDNVYVSDRSVKCVLKFNRQRKLIKKTSSSAGLNSPRGMAVHGDRVWVGDNGNNRVVIFNQSLGVVKVISSKGSGNGQFNNIHSIANDEQGCMYVSDFGNHRVQVFTTDGEHLHTIAPGRGMLEGPTGVCVRDNYVYIVDYTKRNIVICQKDGQYVSTVGGLHQYPFGVAIDNDGFVYVCCSGSNEILIF